MLDLLITGATIVDGTGSPGYTGDVGVRDGRIVALGTVDEAATSTIAADGAVVCPGFVDPHTHYDAQLFWDPFASPSNVHGITSVVAGNCSFALAPLHAEDADYTRRMMARVEGMPLGALETGVDWTWETFGEYLDALEGRIGINAGFIAGHSALRRYVLGPDANVTPADETSLPKLQEALADALRAGALGFSTDISSAHMDAEGNPIPAKGALPEEHLALCEVVGQHPGTMLSGIFDGGSTGWSDFELDHLSLMSATANRVLNWNLLVPDADYPERALRQLELSHHARRHGGRIIALLMPTIVPMTMSFGSYCALFLIPGWREIMALPPAERTAALRSSDNRRRMEMMANSEEAGMFRVLGNFAGYRIGDTYSEANAGLTGRLVSDIAAERGTHPFDTLVDISIADDLKTVLWPPPAGDDDETWALRASIWSDDDVLLAGSDAGAHLDRMCGGSYPTQFLAECLRGRRFMPMEQAVHHFTDRPARLFGLRDRGRLTEGAIADLVVFDPESVGAERAHLVHDLPGGAVRLTAGSTGVHHVFVNGVETVRDGTATGALPGTVLRSGRDTDTVTAR
ncbi:MAG: amidohydrolase family protein [Acidimicrobiales bacterium]|nr:amidohydrolase family protein [Acidimicrobiales bacterium]